MNSQATTFFTGTTNRDLDESASIAICHLDEDKAELSLHRMAYGGKRPGYICLSNDNKFLFAVSSRNFRDRETEDSINSLEIIDEGADLRHINTQPSRGKNPTHISVNPSGSYVYAANYSSGSVVSFSFNTMGELSNPVSSHQHTGSGPVSDRQAGPHAHYIHADNSGQFVYSSDLGIDKIMIYKQLESGEIIPNEAQEFLELDPGSGPRHMAFHKNGKYAYILNELSSDVVVCKIDPENGSLTILQKISTLGSADRAFNKAAAIRIHPNGKYLYCSNRGVNSIAVFKIRPEGTLISKEMCREGVEVVRDFNITPSGKFLIAGNKNNDELALFRINPDGSLEFTGNTLNISQPSCIVFFNQ